MGATTGISWCDHTFNPWIGCTKVAPECEHCYAQTYGNRFGVEWGPHGTRRRTSASNWREPLKWDAAAKRDGVRRRVFCSSLADVFEDRPELVPWREKLFWLIELCDGLDWLLLTKRPKDMVRMAPESWARGWPRHAWAGTSAGCQASVDVRVRDLLAVPSRIHFVSGEPLLEAADLARWMWPTHWSWDARYRTPEEAIAAGARAEKRRQYLVSAGRRFIDWVIVGAESGPHSRPCSDDWVRAIRDQCRGAGVSCFVKQLSRPGSRKGVITEIEEFPEDLRVREFPEVGDG